MTAQAALAAQQFERVVVEVRRGDDFEEELAERGSGLGIQACVHRNHAAVGRDGIRRERLAYCQADARTLGDPARDRVLHYGRAREAQMLAAELVAEGRAREQAQRRVEVQQVIVRERLAVQLLGKPLAAIQVERGALLRIRPVAQPLCQRQSQREGAGQIPGKHLPRGGEIVRDRDVVFGRACECRDRKLAAHLQRDVACGERLAIFGVLRRVRQDGYVREVLRRRAQQRDAADIYLFDRLLERGPISRYGLFERIEVDRDGGDLRNLVLSRFPPMLGIPALVENRTEYAGVQGLHAAAEERGKAGHLADVVGGDIAIFEKRAGAARGVDLYAALR